MRYLNNILRNIREKKYQELLEAFSKNEWLWVIGSAESGKTTMLKRLYNESRPEISIMQTGCILEYRPEIVKHINHELQRLKGSYERTISIYMDEIDDEISLNELVKGLKNSKIKLVIFSKKEIPIPYKNVFFEFKLPSRFEINELTSILTSHIKKVFDVETFMQLSIGDMINYIELCDSLEIICSNIEENHKKLLKQARLMGQERLQKKNNVLSSMAIICTPEYRDIRVFEVLLKERI